ncbi:ABC transporter [Caloranaerobacter sp. TR13]|uniref:ABC transporter ATP-binding protein n=1 Tax=Caloranaerobacter sp. TR13 TaxID=1302151 RepID=UPI0006D41AA1|nr:ATP-binding cassette domain-containing protein [Caloranaerobacter sp. TR13]KPU26720.1 ABC transporter [Caloranaerobacter sp. TR13]
MEVSLYNIKKSYGDKNILNISELKIKKGKVTGLIGQNGVGKTTLLNIVAGLDSDFNGVVKYDGKQLSKSILKEMTIVFQRPKLLARSVYENIEYPLKLRKIPKHKRKKMVNEIMNRFEINYLKDAMATNLSGGESQKVSIARGMVFNPKLLILDEPTSNLDSKSVSIIEKEIVNMKREKGTTVIIVTHDPKQIEKICDEVICLQDGKVFF